MIRMHSSHRQLYVGVGPCPFVPGLSTTSKDEIRYVLKNAANSSIDFLTGRNGFGMLS